MFADDIVICSESREQVEGTLYRLRSALGRKVMMERVNGREACGTVRLQGGEVKREHVFKCLGSTVQSNGRFVKR